jgi:hypothetical protein
MHVDLIRLYGSMGSRRWWDTLMPSSTWSAAAIRLTNDLVAVEDVMAISARLIVNPRHQAQRDGPACWAPSPGARERTRRRRSQRRQRT